MLHLNITIIFRIINHFIISSYPPSQYLILHQFNIEAIVSPMHAFVLSSSTYSMLYYLSTTINSAYL